MWDVAKLVGVRFEHPAYLVWLALLPVLVLLSWRSLSGLGGWRRVIALGARCVLVAGCVAALAGPQWVRQTDDQTVVFAVDGSLSVSPAQQQAAYKFIADATNKLRPLKDRVAVVTFGGAATVSQLPQAKLIANRPDTALSPHRTNIAAALRLAMALFPPDTARRLVVLSDGNENVGEALREAGSFAASQVPVDVVSLGHQQTAEMLVDRLTAPPTAVKDATVNLELIVRSQVATTARILLKHNDRLVNLDPAHQSTSLRVKLAAGANRFTIPVPLAQVGAHRFRVDVEPEDPTTDTNPYNNEGLACTVVGTAERVLIVTSGSAAPVDVQSAEALGAALKAGGVVSEQVRLDEIPADPAYFVDCSVVVLCDVSAIALSPGQQQALASFVRDLGGGLIAVGGDQSFSVGGYFRTVLEEVLPVETDRAKVQLMSLAMIIVIDRSGSMGGEKLAMARQGAMGTVDLISESDAIGVIEFDDGWDWVVKLAPASNKGLIKDRIAHIDVGGGTSMYPPLAAAARTLQGMNTNLKHILVLTDGQSQGDDFAGLAKQCHDAGITISTIAVGTDADQNLLGDIAKISGGRMYVADSAKPLPQIFARETVLAGRWGLYEQPFAPTLKAGADDPLLRGFVQADIPPLRGHVMTALKPLAAAPLLRATSEGAVPLMAYWQVGLGRTVAFTSGMFPKWGPEWVGWSGFSKLWTQAARYAARPAQSTAFDVRATTTGDETHVNVWANQSVGASQDPLTMVGNVVRPDFTTVPLQPVQTGPGRFEAFFPSADPGTYIVSMAYRQGSGASAPGGTIQMPVSVSYSPEYRDLTSNDTLLGELARRTEGRALELGTPAIVFDAASLLPAEVRRPFWEDLVRLVLILLIIDVAVRRLALSPVLAARRLRAWIGEMAGRPASKDSAATLATLRGTRDRVREQQVRPAIPTAASVSAARLAAGSTGGTASPANAAGRLDAAAPGESGADALTRALGGADASQPVVAKPTTGRPTATDEEAYTSRLLKAKRARGGV